MSGVPCPYTFQDAAVLSEKNMNDDLIPILMCSCYMKPSFKLTVAENESAGSGVEFRSSVSFYKSFALLRTSRLGSGGADLKRMNRCHCKRRFWRKL